MLIRRPSDIPSSQITPESVYRNRRQFLATMGFGAISVLAGCDKGPAASSPPATAAKASGPLGPYDTAEARTSFEQASTYNNYYEFGTDKADPAQNSTQFQPRPWTVEVSGLAEATGSFDLDDLVPPGLREERVYRMRCV